MFESNIHHEVHVAHVLRGDGACGRGLHGHTWQVDLRLCAPDVDVMGALIGPEFTTNLRAWLEEHVNYVVLLAAADRLVHPLGADQGHRLFRFNAPDPRSGEDLAVDLPAPSAELVALLIARAGEKELARLPAVAGVAVDRVQITQGSQVVARWRCAPDAK